MRQPARIFHLEDGVEYARDLHESLSARGHEVVLHALTMSDAMVWIPHVLVELEVNLAVLDRDLPDGSGVLVAKALREADLQIPIIANSGYETDFGDYNITKLQKPRLLQTIDDLFA